MNSRIISSILLATLAVVLFAEFTVAVITVQIGGATRLGAQSVRSRERYHCFWDCDLVGCQLTRDDDECAYDCDKICRPKYDYSGRSELSAAAAAAADAAASIQTASGPVVPESELKPKSGNSADLAGQLNENGIVSGQTVRLHLPRNVTARNFGIWERCAQDSSTGKVVEHSFSL